MADNFENHGDTSSHRETADHFARTGRTYFNAEMEYQKARASYVGARVKKIITLSAVALVVVFAAFVGITLGIILIIAEHWGALAATGSALGMGIIGIGLCVFFIKRQIARIKRAFLRNMK